MSKLFSFDPKAYAAEYAERGYVHIPEGLTAEYHSTLLEQIEEHLRQRVLKDFALGNKQQALYDFPTGADYHSELVDGVGRVSGHSPDRLVLAERHIKAYEDDAVEEPPAHKDRYASQVSVGFSVVVPQGSRLVFYPRADVGVNPFNSSAELRASLPAERLPENYLPGKEEVVIEDRPRDVVMFRGSALWHLRRRPAGTTMLYLKLNEFNCDPLGEDPFSAEIRTRTEHLAELPDEAFGTLVPMMGRRMDYVHRRYSRDWVEQYGVVLAGEKHFTIDGEEFLGLRMVDGRRTVAAIAHEVGSRAFYGKVRRLAKRGVVDLMTEALPE